MNDVLPFLFVALLAVVVPGPDFALVTRNALTSGRKMGIGSATGIALGNSVHALAATAGLSMIIVTSATAFTIVKIIGATYLTVLGAQALLAAVRRKKTDGDLFDKAPKLGFGNPTGFAGAFRQGFLCNVLNPKAVLFFVSLMPQFIPEGASVTAWTLLLSSILVALAFVWFSLLSLIVAAARAFFRRPKVARVFDGITGTVFLGFGARLALQKS